MQILSHFNRKLRPWQARIDGLITALGRFSDFTIHFDNWNYHDIYVELHFHEWHENSKEAYMAWNEFQRRFHPVLKSYAEIHRDGHFYSFEVMIAGFRVRGYSPHFKGPAPKNSFESTPIPQVELDHEGKKFFAGLMASMGKQELERLEKEGPKEEKPKGEWT